MRVARRLYTQSARLAGKALLLALLVGQSACVEKGIPPIEGIVWQPHNGSLQPRGNWQQLGVHRLLVQWSAVDDLAFVANSGLNSVPTLPDWSRIATEPWAQDVILGLSGRFQEADARRDVAALAQTSLRLAQLPTPLHVVGWYFPVEVDPTWVDAHQLATLLAPLPRPLWISVYDSANVGAEALATSLQRWLPSDVGVFFQDGVGVYARTAEVAREYVDTLSRHFGAQRVRLIAEVFRPAPGGGFRPATAAEIQAQLAHYRGLPIYLFDGPTYLSEPLLQQLQLP